MKKSKTNTFILNVMELIVLIIVASVIGLIFRYVGFPETNIVLVYLLAVLIMARLSMGYFFAIASSITATVAFNYLFTQPYYSLTVNDPSYLITFTIMTITALITSTLTSRVKLSALEAKNKEAETKVLYTLTNLLTDAKDIDHITRISVSVISEHYNCQAACLCFDTSGQPAKKYIQQVNKDEQIYRETEKIQDIKHRMESLRTEYATTDEFYDWPIYGRDNILGVLRIPRKIGSAFTDTEIKLLHSMIYSIALAMDRFQSILQKMKAREETIQERYRGNLLRAISHDLRTPITGIIGTSEMLMKILENDDKCYTLIRDINEDADWLLSLIENILNLSRLQDGKLIINKQAEAIEEIVGSAILHIGKRAPNYEIDVNIPDDLLLVPMDAKLIEQVLVNLLDNAIKHTPVGNEIRIDVANDKKDNKVIFTVSDRGNGIDKDDLPMIFQSFYTTQNKSADSARGIGLGLAICESIVKAHGGTISASNREDGSGSKFSFTLPLEENHNE